MPVWDQRGDYGDAFLALFKKPGCKDPVWSPTSDAELLRRTLAVMARHNVVGVLSGPEANMAAWIEAAPERFIRGYDFNLSREGVAAPDDLAARYRSGQLAVLGEITNQYSGIVPSDPRMEPYWAMAEKSGLPVGIHIGTGPPGVKYLDSPAYRAAMHSALTLEPVLENHPKLRVYIMHAGFPMLDDLLALMYTHPQVYVDTGVIIYTQSRPAFYRYLQGIMDAGFGTRVMFGSDQMVWPETIERAIQVIRDAPFLSPDQKRDILYNNAARFLRLSDDDIARHHGR
jgi:predicted TIM-barrel fold metal-dependent hydrolase